MGALASTVRTCQLLEQPRRHYMAPAGSDDARFAPANKDLQAPVAGDGTE